MFFVVVAIPSVRAASQTIGGTQNFVQPLIVAQDSVQNPKLLVVKDTTQKVTVWAKIAATLRVASLVSASIGIFMGIPMGSVFIIAALAMAFYAVVIGFLANRSNEKSSKNSKWAKKGIVFGGISMVGISGCMFFGLLRAWATIISYFR